MKKLLRTSENKRWHSGKEETLCSEREKTRGKALVQKEGKERKIFRKGEFIHKKGKGSGGRSLDRKEGPLLKAKKKF